MVEINLIILFPGYFYYAGVLYTTSLLNGPLSLPQNLQDGALNLEVLQYGFYMLRDFLALSWVQ